MKFGPVPLAEAEGAILAHAVVAGGRRIGKGRVLAQADIAALAAEGVASVVAARLDPGDVGEAEAAARLAAALVPEPAAQGITLTAPHNGRANLIAARTGIVALDVAAIHRLNRADPAVTFATLPAWQRVAPGTMVGTVKIIPYAVSGEALERACATGRGAISVLPVVCLSATLVLTRAPGDDARLAAKAREAVARRLARLGIDLVESPRVAHEAGEIGAALSRAAGDLILILTGAATSDLHDTAPEAVRQAGGTVARFGMPVDPGNLLFHGRLGRRPVIGLPGCARSPALNGADWVLERIACGVEVTDDEIAAMGVGGLLKESAARPEPRGGGGSQVPPQRRPR
jgi:molybdenum cofactor cytidylyltransferase